MTTNQCIHKLPEHLVGFLQQRAQDFPDERMLTFIDEKTNIEGTLTYAELDARARAIAGKLQRILTAGSKVMLLYPPGQDYVEPLFGCWYAGILPIPFYPPVTKPMQAFLALIQADAH